jgi:hypothetical protein
MNSTLKNILATVAGVIGGSLVNIGLVNLNGKVIPFPEGVDVSTMETLAASMTLFEPIHFLMPWLGHALGTLVGAFIAADLILAYIPMAWLGVRLGISR